MTDHESAQYSAAPNCEIVFTYRDGRTRKCGRSAPYLLGDYPQPQVHICRAHIAAGLDFIRSKDPDEHHIVVWAP